MKLLGVVRPLAISGGKWSINWVLTISMALVVSLLMVSVTVADLQRERAVFYDGVEERGRLLAAGLNDLLAAVNRRMVRAAKFARKKTPLGNISGLQL